MNILGISAYYHDSASCLLIDGCIVAASQEERFSRVKHDASFPINSIKSCLMQADIQAHEIDYVVFHDKPFLKFERLLETYFAFAPQGFKSFATSMPIWLKDKLFQKENIINNLLSSLDERIDWNERLLFSEHHLSHAASAFYPSPFKSSAVLTMDGVGEWATTSFSLGKDEKIEIHKEINFPHSLGLLYSAFTYFTGFKVNSGEYKLMGLAPYGDPTYAGLIKDNLIDIKDDGSFNLDMSYFNYCTGLTMTNEKFNRLFNSIPRKPESQLTQKDMDIAASIQKVTEEIIVKLTKDISKETQEKNLCLAGGVALNCVANGVLIKEDIFDNIWVQPASGDAGGSLGAALAAHHMYLHKPRKFSGKDNMLGSYLGPEFSDETIRKVLNNIGAKFTELSYQDLIKKTAKEISMGRAVGWIQGKMEFGPRALGNRSILADPRSPSTQSQLNLKIKYRESFRPFAPSILAEDLSSWFELDSESPYMLSVAKVKKDKYLELMEEDKALKGIQKLKIPLTEIPAVTHVDYTSRIQTVHKSTNPKYYDLIAAFKEITGCPILVNTSFNIRGEPIVCSVEDAFKCFMGTEMDVLIVGNCILYKGDQKNELKQEYQGSYALD